MQSKVEAIEIIWIITSFAGLYFSGLTFFESWEGWKLSLRRGEAYDDPRGVMIRGALRVTGLRTVVYVMWSAVGVLALSTADAPILTWPLIPRGWVAILLLATNMIFVISEFMNRRLVAWLRTHR